MDFSIQPWWEPFARGQVKFLIDLVTSFEDYVYNKRLVMNNDPVITDVRVKGYNLCAKLQCCWSPPQYAVHPGALIHDLYDVLKSYTRQFHRFLFKKEYNMEKIDVFIVSFSSINYAIKKKYK